MDRDISRKKAQLFMVLNFERLALRKFVYGPDGKKREDIVKEIERLTQRIKEI